MNLKDRPFRSDVTQWQSREGCHVPIGNPDFRVETKTSTFNFESCICFSFHLPANGAHLRVDFNSFQGKKWRWQGLVWQKDGKEDFYRVSRSVSCCRNQLGKGRQWLLNYPRTLKDTCRPASYLSLHFLKVKFLDFTFFNHSPSSAAFPCPTWVWVHSLVSCRFYLVVFPFSSHIPFLCFGSFSLLASTVFWLS